MNQQQSLEFIRTYFHKLFVEHNVDILDEYLDPDYFDDDIGDPHADHIRNSKEFLREWFKRCPTVGVEVLDVMTHDEVLTAYLEWFDHENGVRKSLQKGVAIFVMKDKKIIKRHTFIYTKQS